MKILIVEDDARITTSLAEALTDQHDAVDSAPYLQTFLISMAIAKKETPAKLPGFRVAPPKIEG